MAPLTHLDANPARSPDPRHHESLPLSAEPLICRSCHLPVDVPGNDFDLFERMHYNCLHYEFADSGGEELAVNRTPVWAITRIT